MRRDPKILAKGSGVRLFVGGNSPNEAVDKIDPLNNR